MTVFVLKIEKKDLHKLCKISISLLNAHQSIIFLLYLQHLGKFTNWRSYRESKNAVIQMEMFSVSKYKSSKANSFIKCFTSIGEVTEQKNEHSN